MPDRAPLQCVHGYPAELRASPHHGTGWVQGWAKGCPVCNGRPIGIAFKPGEPPAPPTPEAE